MAVLTSSGWLAVWKSRGLAGVMYLYTPTPSCSPDDSSDESLSLSLSSMSSLERDCFRHSILLLICEKRVVERGEIECYVVDGECLHWEICFKIQLAL